MDVCPIISTLCGSLIRKWHQQWKQTMCRSHYSQTSLIRTSKGQNKLSALQRCPYYRGRECMIFGISGTKRTVRNRVNKACKQALFVRVCQASEGKCEPGVKARVSWTCFDSLAWKTRKTSASFAGRISNAPEIFLIVWKLCGLMTFINSISHRSVILCNLLPLYMSNTSWRLGSSGDMTVWI